MSNRRRRRAGTASSRRGGPPAGARSTAAPTPACRGTRGPPGAPVWGRSPRGAEEGLDGRPDLGGQGDDGAVAGAPGVVDVHVDEAPLRGGLLALALEETDAVDD